MKAKITILAVAAAFVLASAVVAQDVRPDGRTAPQAQPMPGPSEIQTRTAAPSTRQGELPSTTTYTNPPAPPVAVQETTTIETRAYEPPAPAPVVAESTTTTYEELPGSASPYPSVALGGLALIAAGALIRRKL